MRSPGNARKPQIWPVSLSQNSAKITKINRPWPWTKQFWKLVRIHHRAKFQAISSMRSPANARKPQIWPISLSQNSAKITKNQQTVAINESVLKVVKIHQRAKFQVISSMRSPGNARKPQIWPVSLSQNSAKIRKSADRGHKLISSEGGQDTSACKISGHFLHAFSRKCPETPNLTRFTKSK